MKVEGEIWERKEPTLNMNAFFPITFKLFLGPPHLCLILEVSGDIHSIDCIK